ncbi:MAG: putative phosphohydrolase [Parcubacteria group bacterium GW2011_GWD2_40_9]|nr:MAG: putative phosphohydrolase [Parcubacteria group bacterium GW2011_GWE2_40_8]KKR82218.1 MAG: putative phosphohydrolase [Parcubacteria group bacterium GW2011_GWD2_40_9]
MRHHDIVIFYHKDCFDGFGAAYAAWKKFKDKAAYAPLGHSLEPMKISGKKEIYFLDFCYNSQEVMDKIVGNNEKVVIIDHHVTNENITKSVPEHYYDINHSGATLAWQYFHPKKTMPKMLANIEDQDLWKFKLPFTKEVNAMLDLYDFDFKIWDKIIKDFENPAKRKKYIEMGKYALAHKESMVKRAVSRADKGVFEGHDVLISNSSFLASEIGNALVEAGAEVAIIWNQRKGQTHVSIRADKSGKIDVSKIAAKYGGGGHKAASGFGLPADKPFPWKITK